MFSLGVCASDFEYGVPRLEMAAALCYHTQLWAKRNALLSEETLDQQIREVLHKMIYKILYLLFKK